MRKKGHIERDIPDNSHSVFFDPKAQGKKGSGTVIDKIGKSGSGNMVNIFLDKVSIDSIHREGTTKNISIDTATPEQLRLVVRELSRALQALAKGERAEIPTLLWEDSGAPDSDDFDSDDSGAHNGPAGISLDKY